MLRVSPSLYNRLLYTKLNRNFSREFTFNKHFQNIHVAFMDTGAIFLRSLLFSQFACYSIKGPPLMCVTV